MRAKDLMTTELATICPTASVLEAAEIMLQRHVSGLPVVDSSGNLAGMITAGDLLRRAEIATVAARGGFAEFQAGYERLAADYAQSHGKHVGRVMTTALHTVDADAPIQLIVDIMDRHNVKRVPVTQQRRLLGLVSRTDILRAFVEAARRAADDCCDDNEIKRRLFAICTRESWAPLADIDISVRDGVVELVGRISSEAQRRALTAAAESIPGVKSVIDHLVLEKGLSPRAHP
ncbi:CBS domain-containing protein [Nordella sp. HKS 07]|uniref:CBS domain-containing protein n=1 Tax=Nordella sp. HKS 07 TaxID=2712222 RepID=UPI0013E2074F|nr:CBS domain-containing protein [Nordella sp. HKS 07]QIG48927.1 CBS domain-containing protein [Nordella sp. HKS 07]